MIRDPFYRQIINSLKGALDPDIFEECAADILRQDFPNIVPVKGGSDSGLDGAIADGKGRAYPLVVTTGKDVIGNLTRNLKSYIANGGPRRKAIIATSQSLTPRRRINLENRAEKLGFRLIQIYDQNALAHRLYQNQKWCLELLGLTGSPSALSIFPLSKRPLIDCELVGRDEEIRWLLETTGDMLLVGQPGSGKTFLLFQFVKEGHGLFVVNEHISLIATAIRSQKPKAIIVDDAHIHLDLLIALKQLRNEISASYNIIATCWPGFRSQLCSTMNISDSHVRDLKLLSRDQMVEVINKAGISGPVELVRNLVDQARGRPGLAVTLTFLCLNGDVQSVTLGDAICKNVIATFQPLIDGDAAILLASFAIGGESGMEMSSVADALTIPIAEIRKTITMLASGGVISEINNKSLVVNPAQLRFALVRDVFFSGALSLDPQYLIENSISYDDMLITLIGAKARGAIIPYDRLQKLLRKSNSTKVWEAFAWSGTDEAKIAFDTHPEMLISLSHPFLFRIPYTVLPHLLEAAIGDNRPLNSATNHPLRVIGDWVTAGIPGSGQVINRRKMLLQAIAKWIASGGDSLIGFRALKYVFDPSFEDNWTDPGAGNTITIRSGCITTNEMQSIRSFWSSALNIIKNMHKLEWSSIFELIETVVYLGPIRGETPKFLIETCYGLAQDMIQSISEFANENQGVLQRLNRLAETVNLDIQLKINEDFEVLFPKSLTKDWKTEQEKQMSDVRKLVDSSLLSCPVTLAKKLSLYENDIKAIGRNPHPRYTPYFCEIISTKIEKHNPWVKALIDSECPVDLIVPFLRRAANNEENGWVDLAIECLKNPSLRYAPISICLTLADPPPKLLDSILDFLDDYSSWVETMCLRGEVPKETLSKLLTHPNTAVCTKAAIGMWLAEPIGKIEDELSFEWSKCILKIANDDDFWLCDIFKKDPSIAFDWLKLHILQEPTSYYTFKKICEAAIQVINFEHRKFILDILPEDFSISSIASCLVDNNLELYKKLLTSKNLKQIHLAPLEINIEDKFDNSWLSKANLALEAGYNENEIARALRGYSWSWSGKISEMWKKWKQIYTVLCESEDHQIKKIGEIGIVSVNKELFSALDEENQVGIYGRR